MSIPANRVLQLEAHDLDRNYVSIVDESVDSLGLEKFSEELKLILKLYTSISHSQDNETIGMQVYQMKYYGQPKIKTLLLTCSNLIAPYIAKKSNRFQDLLKIITKREGLDLPWLTFDNLILALRGLSIINFVNFIRSGKNLTMQEKILNMSPCMSTQAYYRGVAINKVQMELLYREVVWKVIAEFLTTIIPLVNIQKVKNQMLKVTGLIPRMTSEVKLADKLLAQSQSGKCAICQKQPFNPHIIGCRHVFCYYCLHSSNHYDEVFTCSLCNFCTKDKSQVQRFKMLVSAE